jgi:hypothetical protein
MQLFVDFLMEPDETPQGLEQKLVGLAQFASGIRIVYADPVTLQPVRTDVVRSVFDNRPDIATIVFERFGAVRGDVFHFDPKVRQDSWVTAQLYGVDGDVQQAIRRKMRQFRAAGEEPYAEVLRRVAGLVPATLMFDEATTYRVGREAVWRDFRIVASASEPIPNVPSIVVPQRISPEMLSEFPITTKGDEILGVIRRRSSCDSLAVTFYLYDFVNSVLGLPRQEPEPLQLFQRYCRFRFPMYNDYLVEDVTTQERIHALMNEINRNE